MNDQPPPNLRSRREAQTRAELLAAAIPLFTSQGFEETTMAEVAEAAGVSRRTAYRHFPSKEDLVFDAPGRWLDVFAETVATRADGEPLEAVCRRAVLEVARTIAADHDLVLAIYPIVLATPSLQARHASRNAEWVQQYIGLMLSDRPATGDDPAAASDAYVAAATLAGALVGGTDGILGLWATQPGHDLIELTEQVFEAVGPLWP